VGYRKFKGSEPNTLLLGVIYSLLPFILLAALIWFFLIRQLKMPAKGLELRQEQGTLAQQGKEPDDFQGCGRH